jgi:ATP-dependent DNA ligase
MDRDKMQKVKWTRPKVVAEIAFNEWTPDRHLRHAEFKRIRDDKTIRQVGQYSTKRLRQRYIFQVKGDLREFPF